MPNDDTEGRPVRPTTHEVGADLSSLSVDEIAERVDLLRREIERLEADASRKRASRDAASAVFR